MKIAIVTGHDRRSQGAYSKYLNISENDMARQIASILLQKIDVDIITRRPNTSYSSAMREVLKPINNGDYDVVFELHFNASDNPQANGTECLVFHKSGGSKAIATKFNSYLQSKGLKNRGLVLIKSESERGGYGIVNSKPKWILIEPFFGSSQHDCSIITPHLISEAILNSI